jgi:hypothetical protein
VRKTRTFTLLADHHPEQEALPFCNGQNANVNVTSMLKVNVWRKPTNKTRGKERHLAVSATMSFGQLLNEVVASPREITHSFCSYSVDCGLTGAIGVELKCGASTGVPSVFPRHAQEFATTTLRLRAPDPQLFASTSTSSESDVAIKDAVGHFSGGMSKSFPTFHLVHDSNLRIRRHHAASHLLEQEPVLQLRQWWWGQGLLSGYGRKCCFIDKGPPAYEGGNSVFCDGRLSEGTRGEEKEEIG